MPKNQNSAASARRTEDKKKTIALCGISNVSNLGCEAIIRSTCAFIREAIPECRIIYASRSRNSDRRILSDLDIEILQLNRRADIVTRVLNKALALLRLRQRIPYDRYRALCKRAGTIFSVGGDIYTVEKKEWNDHRRCYNQLVQLGEYAMRHDCKLILYGASVGPFPKTMGNERYFARHLAKMDLIVCREQVSIQYLQSLGIRKQVIFSPDPAFYLRSPTPPVPVEQREGIAVNLSPRILSVNDPAGKQIQMLSAMLMKISRELNEKVYLFPHVYSSKTSDDDLAFLRNVLANVAPGDRMRIKLCEEKRDFLKAKEFLKHRKMVVAARMHCAINAMSEAVPTILISYSQKTIGMAEYMYGSKEWVIADDNICEELPYLVARLYGSLRETSQVLESHMKELTDAGKRNGIDAKIRRIVLG